MHLRSDRNLSEVDNTTKNTKMTEEINQVVMTSDMLQNLLAGMQRLLQPDVSSPSSNQTVSTNGNFSQCTSRFDGNPTNDVDAFIDSITVYKQCVSISEDNALKGLSMLLTENAATWWQGIKSSITTFDDALESLRHAYGYAKPAYQIYRELFSHEQNYDERTDIFIGKARALLSHLPPDPPVHETVQLDMVYGLLTPKIRERVPRDKVKNFKELLEAARAVEQTLYEKKKISNTSNNQFNPVQGTRKVKSQCSYCKNFGHVKDDCRKLARVRSEQATNKPTSTNQTPPTVVENKPIVCYGCGKPGFVRGNCPTCNPRPSPLARNETTLSSEFLYNSTTPTGSTTPIRPLVYINIHGHNGLAFIDTGAKSSVAGSGLSKILLQDEVPYTTQDMSMTLADGKERRVNALLFEVTVVLQNKKIPLTLISVPEHENSRTLLGVDFIHTANLIIDIPSSCWHFANCPQQNFSFVEEANFQMSCHTNTINFADVSLRTNEGVTLPPAERQKLDTLLQDHADLFVPNPTATPFAEHSIKLLDDTPTAVPPYRMSEPRKEQLRTELDRLLEEGTIEECESPYVAPVVLVPKKDGSIRLTVDYRRLNAITCADRYPLPRIDDLLHAAKKTQYMTTLDLKSGYHQISVRPEDRDKTAFITPFGIFRFTRMPFGLRNAPSTFQRLIDRFRSGLQNILILAYLDDLIILSPSFEVHLQDLNQVFQRLRYFKLHLNRAKCTFSCSSVLYLGHVITPDGLKPDPAKINSILGMAAPRNVKEVLTFLQTCSWFRRFIDNFAEVSRPLSVLTKKKTNWTWGPEQNEAFGKLKHLLASPPILRQADPGLPYVLRTDASSYALGACLLQGEGPDERPVEYASRLLTPAEMNYHTSEREALAVVWSVNKYRGYLECATIIVKTDHQPLKWLLSLKSPTGRLARWALQLQSYDIRIEYVPGRANVVADTLSRPPIEKTAIHMVSIELPTNNSNEFRSDQLADPELHEIIRTIESPTSDEMNFKKWTERGYLMTNGILYRYSPQTDEDEPQQVVPKAKIPEVLAEYHDSSLAGHCGIERTLQRIAPRYYWTGMRKSITDYVAKCIHCQRYRISNMKPAGLLQTPIQSQRFETIAIDLFGPLPETDKGERWIYIIEDTASRWIEIFPLKVASAEACAKCLIDEIILRYGLPRKVISDNGVQFVSAIMQQIAFCLGFKQALTPYYHPEANPVERKNRDLKTQLSILCENDHTSWSDNLPAVRFSLNTARCSSTGFTPAYLTFARELRTPDDVHRDLRAIVANDNFIPQITPYLTNIGKILQEARENHETHQDKSKRYADDHRRSVTLKVGDKVLVDVHALSKSKTSYTSKFAPRRDGPYRISKEITPTTFEVTSLEDVNTPLGKYHVSALTPFIEVDEESTPVRPLRKRGRPPIQRPTNSSPNRLPDTPVPLPEPTEYPEAQAEVSAPTSSGHLPDEDVTQVLDETQTSQRSRRRIVARPCQCCN